MGINWTLPAIPLVGLLANVCGQMIFAHGTHRVGYSIMVGCVAGFGATVSLLALAGDDATLSTIVIATYLALAFCFWTFLNLNITSLRVRILREVLAAGGSLSYRHLAERYTDDEFLRRRLERLLQLEQISCNDERWYLESRTLPLLARTLQAVRYVIFGSSK